MESTVTPLATELAYYEIVKAALLQHHEGKFVLIIGAEQLGIFDKAEDAYKYGIETRGNVPMLIRKIQAAEQVEHIPALVLGLINAHPA